MKYTVKAGYAKLERIKHFRISEVFEQSHVPITYIWESNKDNEYHSIKIVPASNRKIVETEANLIPLTDLYMISHYPGLVKRNSFKSVYQSKLLSGVQNNKDLRYN